MYCFVYMIFQSCDMFSQTIIYGLKYSLWSVLRIGSMYCWARLYLSLWLLPSENPNKVFLYKTYKIFYGKQSVAGTDKIQLKAKHLWICLRRQLKPIHFTKKQPPKQLSFSYLWLAGSWQDTKDVVGEGTWLNSFQLWFFSRVCYVQLRAEKVTLTLTLPVNYKIHWPA